MRIAIQLCRASRGAKQTTLGKALAISVAAVLMAAGPVLAEHTRWWRQSSFEDFDKGTAKGVALRSDGKLFLAPHFAEFPDANLPYPLALRAEPQSNPPPAPHSTTPVPRLSPTGHAPPALHPP